MQTANQQPRRHPSAKLFGALWRDRRGVTAIITALGAMILMGFAALAIDVAVWHVNQRKIQGAADQAAVAAGLAGDLGNNMTTEAQAIAASFGLVNGQNGVTVAVNSPPSQGTYHSDSNALEVVITQVQPQYLSRMLLSAAPTVTVRAVALYGTNSSNGAAAPSGAMCIMALDETGKLSVGDLDLSGSANINAPTCDVYNDSYNSDGTEVSGSASLSARNIYLTGNYETSGGGTVSVSSTGVLRTWVNPMPDPYASMTIPSFTGCGQTNYKLTTGSATISHGVYCGGISVSGGSSLTLNAGTYILDQGNLTVSGGSTVTGTGVTILLTSSTGNNYGSVQISGGTTVTLTAPTAGATAGVPGMAIWVDKNAPTTKDNFSGGATENVNGVMYLPSQEADFSGGSSSGTSCSQLVALTIKFTGNAYFQHSCAGSGVIDPPATPVLTQ